MISRQRVNKYPKGSFEYVLLHGLRQKQKGKNVSETLIWLRDPRKAFKIAQRYAYIPDGDVYLPNGIPESYLCSVCGAKGVKLWRYGASSCIELHCAQCAAKDQGEDISSLDRDGRYIGFMEMRTDQIGSFVPAVPDESLRPLYWGYTSVPTPAVLWWRALPNSLEKDEIE